VCLTEIPCEIPLFGDFDDTNVFEAVQACMHFHKYVHNVCLYGSCVCLIVFSAQLAVPVHSSVQVAHDHASVGRSVSFLSPVQFLPQIWVKDKRITPVF